MLNNVKIFLVKRTTENDNQPIAVPRQEKALDFM